MGKTREVLSCFLIAVLMLSTITAVTAESKEYKTSFETDFDGFGKNGNVQLSITDEITAHTGIKCLKVVRTGTEAWAGAALEIINTELDAEYEISAWGRLASKSNPTDFKMTMYVADPAAADGKTKKYITIDTAKLCQDKWVELKGIYKSLNPGKLSSPEKLYFESLAEGKGVNMYLDDITIRPIGSAPAVKVKPSKIVDIQKLKIEKDLPSIKDVYKDYFPIGAAVNGQSILNPDPLQELVLKHYNSLTAGNSFKWINIHPADGKYAFEVTDNFVDFAEKHNMEVIGHTLIWHHKDANPKWIFVDDAGNKVNRDILLKRMEEHIKTVVGRYKGRVKGWDVVNEAIDTNASDNLRESEWKKIIGNDYLEYAYKYAHEADPDAELYYNDYGENNSKRRDAIYNLVKNLIDKGCKINSIGMQSHYDLSVSASSVKSAIEKFTSLGVKVEVSELDINAYTDKEADLFKNGLTPDRSMALAGKYAELFNVYKQFKGKIGRVTTWCAYDGQSTLNSPLLFDRMLKAKEAFYAVVNPEKYLTDDGNKPNTGVPDAVNNSDEIMVNIDGSIIAFEDVKPIIQNGRTLVPMRKIFESLNAQISWNDETQTVTATKDYKTIMLTIGEKVAEINGQSITLDVPAIIMNDRTMVPVRFIAESLGTNVTWDDVTKTVIIKSK